MKIIGVFTLMATAVVLFLTVPTIEANPLTTPCSVPEDCPSSMTCFKGSCINLCDRSHMEGRKCKTENHEVSFECEPGYETPQYSVGDLCYRKEWGCTVDPNDPNRKVKCKIGNWECFGTVWDCY